MAPEPDFQNAFVAHIPERLMWESFFTKWVSKLTAQHTNNVLQHYKIIMVFDNIFMVICCILQQNVCDGQILLNPINQHL